MPIYEYRCSKCGALLEVLQRMHDKPLKKCPKCSGLLEKLISRTSFQLKGTGWYVTDYARKGKSEGDSTSASTKSDASSTSDTAAAPKTSPKKQRGKSGGSD